VDSSKKSAGSLIVAHGTDSIWQRSYQSGVAAIDHHEEHSVM